MRPTEAPYPPLARPPAVLRIRLLVQCWAVRQVRPLMQ